MVVSVTVVSVSMPAISETCRYASDIHNKFPEVTFQVHYLGKKVESRDSLRYDVEHADILLTDLMGAEESVFSLVISSMKKCKGHRLAVGGMAPPLGRLGGFDAAKFRLNETDEENLHRIAESWKRASPEDIRYIFDLTLGKYMGLPIPEPDYNEIHEGVFIKDPVTMVEYDDPDRFREEHDFGNKMGTVLLCYSGNSYPTSNIEGVRMVYSKLCEFADVLPVAMNSYNIRYIPLMEAIAGKPDVIVNLQPFRFMAGPMGGDSATATDLLKRMDSAYLSPFFMTKTSQEEWRSDQRGVNPMEFMLSVFLPELDGASCTLPIGFMEEKGELNSFGIMETDIVPLEDRVNRVVGKVRGLLNLRRKPNSEKRIAVISYNYPPGEANIFGGSFLDGLGSISSILKTLEEAGYDTRRSDPESILDRILRNGMTNGSDWFDASDEVIRYSSPDDHGVDVIRRWGRQPGTVMTDSDSYLIPGMVEGNVFIGIQPPRISPDDDQVSAYHDQSIPPHHQYFAFYEWIRDVFKADAVIHLGTHGTLEFLPGKENAVSSDCYPDRLMGDVPHFYIYYIGNISEAMIAKRRSHASMISYMSPPFVKSGVYGDMEILESSIAEYRESLISDPGRAEVLLEDITEKARSMRLPTNIDELEDELVDIRESLIPYGLHRFGDPYSEDDARAFATNSMRFPHDGVEDPQAAFGSLESAERAYDAWDSEKVVPSTDGQRDIIRYRDDLISRSMETMEREFLLRALDGRYLEALPGGDAMKDPDILPSGHNLVQFNPDHIPSIAAFKRGVEAAEQTINDYRQATGDWPKRAALILWGLETSRTQGMTIGQICGYLGLRQVKTSGEFSSRFEVIPLEELGRPRIDVTISMCGFFRDMFPSIIKGINRLFSMVSDLDEPEQMNIIRRDTELNRRFLESSHCEGDIEALSRCRLFGPKPGEYGTDITDTINSSKWKDESELGLSFARNLHYAYTDTNYGEDIEGLLENNHHGVDLISQVRDSTDREIIDLDHYYEFLGGLSKSVENVCGRKAEVFVVDGSGPKVKTQTVARSIEHGVRTRLLNPKWIDGLLKVKYHGTQKINDRFENVLGLAATTGAVDTGVFSDMLDCYVRDEENREKVRENNNWAYISMLERLMEAYSRGYWKATDEEIEMLREAYSESETMAEEASDHPRP